MYPSQNTNGIKNTITRVLAAKYLMMLPLAITLELSGSVAAQKFWHKMSAANAKNIGPSRCPLERLVGLDRQNINSARLNLFREQIYLKPYLLHPCNL
jgi:hypothetical protein